jgi:hypothetical protein
LGINPKFPVLLVTDWDVDHAHVPGGIDRVMPRLAGPAVLLQTLRELTAGVIAISVTMTELRRRLKYLRASMAELKKTVNRARNLPRKK